MNNPSLLLSMYLPGPLASVMLAWRSESSLTWFGLGFAFNLDTAIAVHREPAAFSSRESHFDILDISRGAEEFLWTGVFDRLAAGGEGYGGAAHTVLFVRSR